MSGNGGTFNKESVNKKRALIVLYLLMISKKRSQKNSSTQKHRELQLHGVFGYCWPVWLTELLKYCGCHGRIKIFSHFSLQALA